MYGELGSAPGLGLMPDGVRKAKAPPPDGRAIFECVGRVPEEDAVKVVACFAEP